MCWRCRGCCSALACGGHLQPKTSATTPRSTPGSSAWASVYQCGEAAVSIRRAWTFCWTSSMWVSGSTSSLRVSCTFPSFNDIFLKCFYCFSYWVSAYFDRKIWSLNPSVSSFQVSYPILVHCCVVFFGWLFSFLLNHPIPVLSFSWIKYHPLPSSAVWSLLFSWLVTLSPDVSCSFPHVSQPVLVLSFCVC